MSALPRLAFSLEQVRTFVAVAQTENMSRAAEALSLTQGAVTQQVKHLERALQLRLLERYGRRLRLTTAGRAVATACASAAREIEVIEETARLHRSLGMGALRIGAALTCASHYLPALLAAFAERFPAVEIQVTVGNSPTVAEGVATGELDCGLVEGAVSNWKLEERLMFEDELVFVVGSRHELATAKRIDVRALQRQRYLSREPDSALEDSAHEMLGDAYERCPHIVLTHLDAVRAAAVEGLGFAVLPAVAISRELKDGVLVRLPLPSKKRWIRAVRRTGSLVPAVEQFWRLLPPGPPHDKGHERHIKPVGRQASLLHVDKR